MKVIGRVGQQWGRLLGDGTRPPETVTTCLTTMCALQQKQKGR